MAQAVLRRPLTAETRIRPQDVPCTFCGVKMALEHVFLRVLRFPPVNVIPPGSLLICIIWRMNGHVGCCSSETVSPRQYERERTLMKKCLRKKYGRGYLEPSGMK
jgi:hypothetical protein